MKRTEYFNPRSAARLVMAAACILILAAACTTDDDPLRPAAADDRLVPFTFTAVAPPAMTAAHTRAVPGNDTWKGDGTEKIKVMLEANWTGNTSTGTYTVISSTGKTAALPGDQLILWPSKNDAATYSIYAWYPAREPGEHNIIDQSTPEKLRQADMLRTINQSVFYNTIPVLTFWRLMAKVRVELTGVDASATDIEVGILSCPKFRLNSYGSVEYINTTFEDYITACRDTKDANTVAFEAVLCPESGGIPLNITKQNFIRITTGHRTYCFTPAADTPKYFEKGSLYTYTVDIPSPTTRTAAAVIPGNSTVIPGTKAVIPGAKVVIPGLTRDLPPRRAGFIGQEIAGQARNDRGKESRPH